MEPLNRTDIKEIIIEALAPLVTEMKASNDAHEKDIERLTKQSAEHYLNFKNLEEKMTTQVFQCQAGVTHNMERSGERVNTIERDLTRMDERVDNLETSFKEMTTNKQFNISQWLVAAGVIAVLIVEFIPLIKG